MHWLGWPGALTSQDDGVVVTLHRQGNNKRIILLLLRNTVVFTTINRCCFSLARNNTRENSMQCVPVRVWSIETGRSEGGLTVPD